jgi:hypothetical protein
MLARMNCRPRLLLWRKPRRAAVAVLASLAFAACGGGGTKHTTGAGNGTVPAAAASHAGGGGSNSPDAGGPPAGAGNGHIPANRPAAGAGGPNATPDRSPDKLRAGKWIASDFTGEIVAHVSAPCTATAVAYQPSTDPSVSYFQLTGDGRVKFVLTWARPGVQPGSTTTITPNAPPPALTKQDEPDGTTVWSQAGGMKGTSDDKTLTLSANFDTPSQLVGRWQYSSTAPLGSCSSNATGQGTFTAHPT